MACVACCRPSSIGPTAKTTTTTAATAMRGGCKTQSKQQASDRNYQCLPEHYVPWVSRVILAHTQYILSWIRTP